MGAEFQLEYIEAKDTDELKRKWKELVIQDEEVCQEEYGDDWSYSGTIVQLNPNGDYSIDIVNGVMEGSVAACEYIQKNHSKWHRALAVKYRKIPDTNHFAWAVGGWCSS